MVESPLPNLEEARRAVRPLAERFELASRLEPYDPYRWRSSIPRLPVLNLDDVSAIPFLDDISGVEEYQHRARLRARGGDLFAAGTPETEGYEEYCREKLDLGSVDFVFAKPDEGFRAVARACSSGRPLAQIADHARSAGGLVLHPYMGIEAVWELARRIEQESQTPVIVIGPPPPVTWIANDKGAFSDLVSVVLGREWLVETHAATDPAALAGLLLTLAGRHRRVALKRLRCASAMGNAVFDGPEIQQMGAPGVEEAVGAFLDRTEWQGDEEVLAVAWEETDFSPSAQLWIPPPANGPPLLDGLYEQILEGERGMFLGSRPSTLPARVNDALAAASLQVAAGLQVLGYVGRCSFDLLVVGDPQGDFELRFTECNGRWGGTSTPMSLLDRLVDGPRPPYRAQDFLHRGLVGMTFSELLAAVGDEIFDPRASQGRFVFYNVGPLREFGKLDVIALGRTQEEAEEAMLERLPRLLGL
jgi:hypothetical protein